MAAVGIRELKARASQVIRRVRERGEEIEVTHHGKVVARLVPASGSAGRNRPSASAWSTLDRVAKEIAAAWPKGRSATAAVREGRRDL
jgi:prevent-host-death family protein